MSKMVIYDPAMCCSTGVCGPSIDPDLLRVSTVIDNLKNAGVIVERLNLSSNPQAFIQCQAVSEALNRDGADVLPITMVDEEIVKTGKYPTNEEFAHWLGIGIEQIQPTHATKVKVRKCGCGPKGCC